jgi:two-component sensor histidine kinase
MTSATRDGGDRRDAAPAADEAGPDRELGRLRTENLALKAELIELRLAQGRGAARGRGGAGAGLRDLAGELRDAASALEASGLDLRRAALRSERLAEAVRERDGRLAEMSHRVKNDLFLVTSLLRVEAERQRNPAARAALGRAGARVEAVARVHELLCHGDGSGTVAVDRYLRETCAGLAELLGVDGRHRALVVRAEAAVLPADTARSLGLVVNELVTNAFRHAFAADGPGTVWVEFGRDADGRLRLSVADDGAGLPDGADAGGGLGLRLVTMTAEQLGATLDVGRDGGTHVTLTLPASSGGAVIIERGADSSREREGRPEGEEVRHWAQAERRAEGERDRYRPRRRA